MSLHWLTSTQIAQIFAHYSRPLGHISWGGGSPTAAWFFFFIRECLIREHHRFLRTAHDSTGGGAFGTTMLVQELHGKSS